jgi:predicted hotdog family 3-hydroxylacyl-ACP dehydratase
MELIAIAVALWVAYIWGKKDAYRKGFNEGVKKSKDYTLEVRVKEKK